MLIETLRAEHFEQCLVWTWDDSNDFHAPVNDFHVPSTASAVLPDDLGTLFVAANILPKQGPALSGYVIWDECVVYALGVFAGNDSFVFNAGLPNLAEKELPKLAQVVGSSPFELFPLLYVTPFRDIFGAPLRGKFSVDE